MAIGYSPQTAENKRRIMPIEFPIAGLQAGLPAGMLKYMKTFRKFELITLAERPTFKNDYEYVDYALSILQLSFATPFEVFTNDLEISSTGLNKSFIVSEQLRNMGNFPFKEGRMFEAHNLYTLSIAYAKSGSKELALAYGNRSAVLFEKQYYKECLEDIKRAFENDYPLEKKAKLFRRQAKAEELLSTQKKILYHKSVPTIERKNPSMPSASECIEINKNEEFGRHIVANRAISPGEVLLVESPYSHSIFPASLTSHCSECLEVCYDMIPCEKCSGVLYCTKACRRKAYISYHQYECPILVHFGYDMINWNATRMSIKAIKEYDRNDDTNPNVYRSDRYKEYSELISHKGDDDLHKMLITRAAGAAKVFYALKKYTDIFSVFDLDDNENILKSWLFNNTWIDLYNGVDVRKYNTDLYIEFGRAIYSTLAMFNHACNDNVAHSFYGSTIVLRAKKNINKGEQCFINYGVDPVIHSKNGRQQYLHENFHFTCKCLACVQNWPKKESLSKKSLRLMPPFEKKFTEFCLKFESIDENRKKLLFEQTLSILNKIELDAPVLAYTYTKDIFNKLMLEGNACIPF